MTECPFGRADDVASCGLYGSERSGAGWSPPGSTAATSSRAPSGRRIAVPGRTACSAAAGSTVRSSSPPSCSVHTIGMKFARRRLPRRGRVRAEGGAHAPLPHRSARVEGAHRGGQAAAGASPTVGPARRRPGGAAHMTGQRGPAHVHYRRAHPSMTGQLVLVSTPIGNLGDLLRPGRLRHCRAARRSAARTPATAASRCPTRTSAGCGWRSPTNTPQAARVEEATSTCRAGCATSPSSPTWERPASATPARGPRAPHSTRGTQSAPCPAR